MDSGTRRSAHVESGNRRYLAMPQTNATYIPENPGIAKLMATLKKAESSPGVELDTREVDVDRGGRKDLVVWQVTYQSWRTDFYIFLRGADGRLPDRPTQILHCRGLPIPVNSTWTWSPIADLNGDGKYELVLLGILISSSRRSAAWWIWHSPGNESRYYRTVVQSLALL